MKPSILRREAPERTTPSPGLRPPSPARRERGHSPRIATDVPKPANSPGSSLLGLRDEAIHTDVRVASAL
ncbi:MAG: hypothetical protein LBI62_09235 [Candidatus Accumulibacter sp.]|nr:hypothetical protein [Accumulibacter sp.]